MLQVARGIRAKLAGTVVRKILQDTSVYLAKIGYVELPSHLSVFLPRNGRSRERSRQREGDVLARRR
jgi:hypothetical protein